MNMNMYEKKLQFLLDEDHHCHTYYTQNLPGKLVEAKIKFKEPMVIAGLPFFCKVFEMLGAENIQFLQEFEGKIVYEKFEVNFTIPFSALITGERLALNLLQRASSVATHTYKVVEKAKLQGVKILDTRKTMPGLRFLDKYATRLAGAYNHRFTSQDIWMVKDNHKKFFGGLKEAYNFFESMNSYYTPIIVEIHNLLELEEAKELNVRHLLIDNFSIENLWRATQLKSPQMTFEISGGIHLGNMDEYLIDGVDAISMGEITHSVKQLDISLKI